MLYAFEYDKEITNCVMSGYDCPLFYDYLYCTIDNKLHYDFKDSKTRPSDCPLIDETDNGNFKIYRDF